MSPTSSTRTSASTSSAATGASIPYEDVVALGKRLVEELGLGSSVDTLGRWMSHFVAELIEKAETAPEADREPAQRDCAELILRLWSHRGALPGRQPLRSFERIFQTLDSLGNDSSFRYFQRHAELENQWLDFAVATDDFARAVIRFCLDMASLEAAEEEQKWIETGLLAPYAPDPGLVIIEKLVQKARNSSEIGPSADEDLTTRAKAIQDTIRTYRKKCGYIVRAIAASNGESKPAKRHAKSPRTRKKRVRTKNEAPKRSG